MKLSCPECNAKYSLDISKIPAASDKGIIVTCPKCKHKFPLDLKSTDSGTEGDKSGHEIIIPCPHCGHINVSSQKCAGCGKSFSQDDIDKFKVTIGS